MKNIAALLILLALFIVLLFPGCSALTPNKIVAATNANWPPFEYVNEKTRQIEGFDIDLMNEVTKRAGIKVEYKNVDFEALLSGMATCKYDAAISSITITEERKQSIAFSDPYIIAGQVVVIRTDTTDIADKDNLTGKIVGAQTGTTGAAEVNKIRNATLKTYDQIDLAYQDLIGRKINAVVSDNPVALAYVGRYSGQLKIAGNIFTSEYYGIAICKTNPELLAKINSGLKSCIDEGLIDKLITKWLSKQ